MNMLSCDMLRIPKECVFSDVPFRLKDDTQEIRGDVGELIFLDSDTFVYKTIVNSPFIRTTDFTSNKETKLRSEYYNLEAKEKNHKKLICDFLRKGYRCIVSVTRRADKSDKDNRDIVFMYLGFILAGQRFPSFTIEIGEDIRKDLIAKHILKADAELKDEVLNASILENFLVTDGIVGSFNFVYLPFDGYKNDQSRNVDMDGNSSDTDEMSTNDQNIESCQNNEDKGLEKRKSEQDGDGQENIRQQARKEEKIRQDAEALAAKLEGMTVKVSTKVSSNGKVFGSVSNIQVAEALAAQGIEIDRRNISIEGDTLKEVGTFDAAVKCYRKIKANIKVEVAGTEE